MTREQWGRVLAVLAAGDFDLHLIRGGYLMLLAYDDDAGTLWKIRERTWAAHLARLRSGRMAGR